MGLGATSWQAERISRPNRMSKPLMTTSPTFLTGFFSSVPVFRLLFSLSSIFHSVTQPTMTSVTSDRCPENE